MAAPRRRQRRAGLRSRLGRSAAFSLSVESAVVGAAASMKPKSMSEKSKPRRWRPSTRWASAGWRASGSRSSGSRRRVRSPPSPWPRRRTRRTARSPCRATRRQEPKTAEIQMGDGQWYGGDAGIRTLDRALQPYNGLANRRLQPLGHVSGSLAQAEPTYARGLPPLQAMRGGRSRGGSRSRASSQRSG